jgi:hypothetical protein
MFFFVFFGHFFPWLVEREETAHLAIIDEKQKSHFEHAIFCCLIYDSVNRSLTSLNVKNFKK